MSYFNASWSLYTTAKTNKSNKINQILQLLNGSRAMNLKGGSLCFRKGHVSLFTGLLHLSLIKRRINLVHILMGFAVIFFSERARQDGPYPGLSYGSLLCDVVSKEVAQDGYHGICTGVFSSFTLLTDNGSGQAILQLLLSVVVI